MKNIFRKLPANKSLIVTYLQDNQKKYRSRLFTEFIQTQKKCPIYLKKMSIPITCNWNNKPNCFLWTRPLNNLILAKYLTYVFATLRKIFLQSTSKWLFLELTDSCDLPVQGPHRFFEVFHVILKTNRFDWSQIWFKDKQVPPPKQIIDRIYVIYLQSCKFCSFPRIIKTLSFHGFSRF